MARTILFFCVVLTVCFINFAIETTQDSVEESETLWEEYEQEEQDGSKEARQGQGQGTKQKGQGQGSGQKQNQQKFEFCTGHDDCYREDCPEYGCSKKLCGCSETPTSKNIKPPNCASSMSSNCDASCVAANPTSKKYQGGGYICKESKDPALAQPDVNRCYCYNKIM